MSILKIGIEKGRKEMLQEIILETLSELGGVSEELKMRIQMEEDINVLMQWSKSAARADSVDEFLKKCSI